MLLNRMRVLVVALSLGALIASSNTRAGAEDAGVAIPAHNRADQREPPPRPPQESAQACGRLVFDAVVHDDPARAAECFFPRAAFVQLKAMQHPERYYDKLRARFDHDIHALHTHTPDLEHAAFERLELGHRGGFMKPGEEGNRLPYWAARHASLHYRVRGELRRLEVRVLITWDDRWYVIHLSEFH